VEQEKRQSDTKVNTYLTEPVISQFHIPEKDGSPEPAKIGKSVAETA
jgi:hypothetical protein